MNAKRRLFTKTIKTKENDAGVLVIKEDDRKTRYEILTYFWNWRWWKIYFVDKVVQILSWTAIVTLEIDWKDNEITITSDSWDFLIPAWVPNIFYFPETTQMIEEFIKGTQAQEFKRYKEMKI